MRLPAGTTQLVLDKTYSNLLPGQTVVVSDGEVDTVCELTAVDIDSNQSTVLTVSPALAHPFKVATTVVYGPFELQMRVDGYNRSTSSVAAGKTTFSLDGQVQGLAPGRYLIVEDANGAEAVRVMTVSYQSGHTDIDLDAPLSRTYALADTVVLGNVVRDHARRVGSGKSAGQRRPVAGQSNLSTAPVADHVCTRSRGNARRKQHAAGIRRR